MSIPVSIINSMTEQIVQQFQPQQVILFGSLAHGEGNAESDVDLLVVMAEAPNKRKITVQIRRALANFGVPKDIVVTTPAEMQHFSVIKGSFLRSVLNEGKIIYERA